MPLDVALAARHAAQGRHAARHPPGQPVRPPRRPAAGGRRRSRDMGLDALVVIGGNGSLTVACMLHDDFGLPIVGVPKTIDNDIVGTDVTFGFTTAVQIATDAIDRLHTTAESHDRVMVVEVMGRHAGWIATHAGIAGGATVDPHPRAAVRHRRGVRRILRSRHERGRYASIVVVAEGAEPSAGHAAVPREGLRPVRPRAPRRHRRDHRPRDRGPHRLRDAGRCCSATSSAAARRRRSTGCCRRATASRRSTPCTMARGARWPRCAATRSCHGAARRDRRPDPPGRHPPLPRGRRGLLRLSCVDLGVRWSALGWSAGGRCGRWRRGSAGCGARLEAGVVVDRQRIGLCSSPLPAGHCAGRRRRRRGSTTDVHAVDAR